MTALACIGTSARAIAGPAEGAAEGDPYAEAKQLYDEGLAKFDTFDFDPAIELWQKAMARLPNTPDTVPIRNALVYNIARAQVKAYELDQDVSRLKKAQLLLEKYLAEELTGEGVDEAERKRVEDQLAEVEAKLAEAETDPEPEARAPLLMDVDPEPEPEAELPTEDKKMGVLTIAGIGVTAVGVAGLGVAAAGAGLGSSATSELEGLDSLEDEARRTDLLDQGGTYNGMAIGGAIAGGVLTVTGVVLIAIGVKKDRERRTAFAPLMAPGTGGVTWQARF